jgi:hypothetical protein
LAYGFLVLEKHRLAEGEVARIEAVKKKGSSPEFVGECGYFFPSFPRRGSG